MSGYKRATITINQDEYDRLREAEVKLRALPEVAPQDYSRLIDESNDAMRKHLEKMQKRQVQLEGMLSGMDQYVQNLEVSTAQRMMEFEKATTQDAQNYVGSLWNNFADILNQQALSFNEQIATSHQVIQDELAQYSRRIRRMTEDQDARRSLAVEWLRTAQQFAEFIDEQYPHEVFTPGRFDQLERQMNQAQANLELGLSEAVIVTSQQLYFSFSDLRVDLERLQHEWNLLMRSAWEAVSQVLVIADQSRSVQAVDLDGAPLSFEIDVDFWSQGRLAQLTHDLSYVKTALESDHDLPDSDTLQRWLTLDLPVYYQALEDIVLESRIAALNSQLRINIADLVVTALQDQGFSLDGSEYESADQRSGYAARLSSLDGSEVLVEVEPSGIQIGENELHVRSFDREERTEHELQQRWYEVSRSLSRFGLEVGRYTREEQPDYAMAAPVKPNLTRQQQKHRPSPDQTA